MATAKLGLETACLPGLVRLICQQNCSNAQRDASSILVPSLPDADFALNLWKGCLPIPQGQDLPKWLKITSSSASFFAFSSFVWSPLQHAEMSAVCWLNYLQSVGLILTCIWKRLEKKSYWCCFSHNDGPFVSKFCSSISVSTTHLATFGSVQ